MDNLGIYSCRMIWFVTTDNEMMQVYIYMYTMDNISYISELTKYIKFANSPQR